MPKFFQNLRDGEEFYSMNGKMHCRAVPGGKAADIQDEAILYSFAPDNQVLTPDEWAEQYGPKVAPVTPAFRHGDGPAPPAGEPATVPDSEFDAPPAAGEPGSLDTATSPAQSPAAKPAKRK